LLFFIALDSFWHPCFEGIQRSGADVSLGFC